MGHLWANDGKDEGSSSIVSCGEVAFQSEPVSGPILTETFVRLSTLSKVINKFLDANDGAINATESPSPFSATTGLGTHTPFHVTLGQAIDLQFKSSEMERLILAVTGRVYVPAGNVVWKGQDRFASSAIPDNASGSDEAYQHLL